MELSSLGSYMSLRIDKKNQSHQEVKPNSTESKVSTTKTQSQNSLGDVLQDLKKDLQASDPHSTVSVYA